MNFSPGQFGQTHAGQRTPRGRLGGLVYANINLPIDQSARCQKQRQDDLASTGIKQARQKTARLHKRFQVERAHTVIGVGLFAA